MNSGLLNKISHIKVEIKSSLEWQLVRAQLDAQINSTSYNTDLKKMLRSIDNMVTDLSKLEVEARRMKNSDRCDRCSTKLAEINSAVHTLDQWIVTAILMS